MKISQKGLYALQAMMRLARRYNEGAIRIRDIAYDEGLPEKFLELILLEMKNARMVESVRGAKGGYRLRRPPTEIYLAEIIRLMDGALAPFGDAEQLRDLIVAGRATPSLLVSHELPLTEAPGAYEKFDQRVDGFTKVLLHPANT